MNWKNLKAPFKALVIVAVCAISLWAVIPVQKTIHLGLDLQGGARLLLQLYPTAGSTARSRRKFRRRRARSLIAVSTGSASPSLRSATSEPIASCVELPAVKDPDQAERLLKQVAVLDYKIVPFDVMQKADAAVAVLTQPNLSAKQKADAEQYVSQTAYDASGEVVYSGKDLKGAQASYDQAGRPDITFQTKDRQDSAS